MRCGWTGIKSNEKPFDWCVCRVQSWILLKTYNSSSRSMTNWRPTFAITSLLAKTHVCIGIFICTTHIQSERLIKETERIFVICLDEIQYQQWQQQPSQRCRKKVPFNFVLISNDLNVKVSIRPNQLKICWLAVFFSSSFHKFFVNVFQVCFFFHL